MGISSALDLRLPFVYSFRSSFIVGLQFALQVYCVKFYLYYPLLP